MNSHVQQGIAKSELEKQVSILQQENIVLIEAVNTTSQALVTERERNPSVISCADNQKDYIKLLINMERKYKMPKGLLQNVAYHESRYNPNAISHKGAVGIMQLHPRWHKSVNPYDPYESIPYGAKYLKSLYDRFQDWELALAAWNWGQGNMGKYSFHKAPAETKNFVKNVMKGIIT